VLVQKFVTFRRDECATDSSEHKCCVWLSDWPHDNSCHAVLTVHKEESGRTAVIMKNISLLERLLCAIDSVLAMFGNDTLCNCDR